MVHPDGGIVDIVVKLKRGSDGHHVIADVRVALEPMRPAGVIFRVTVPGLDERVRPSGLTMWERVRARLDHELVVRGIEKFKDNSPGAVLVEVLCAEIDEALNPVYTMRAPALDDESIAAALAKMSRVPHGIIHDSVRSHARSLLPAVDVRLYCGHAMSIASDRPLTVGMSIMCPDCDGKRAITAVSS